MRVLFWVLAGLVVCVYIGYPVLVAVVSRVRRAPTVRRSDGALAISLIIAAYNEERTIAQKIENCLALDYPKDKLEIIIASDGSTDRTNEIVEAYSSQGVRLVALTLNRGKSSAQNRAVREARGDILFFTDANVALRADALRAAVGNFSDPRVGCVIGRVTYRNLGDTSVSEGEGFYWRYELFLRSKESEGGSLAMGSGPIMAIRRCLFTPLDSDVGEDFVLPMKIAMRGYRVVYEPLAVSEETLFQNTPLAMHRSRVRIITKDLRGLWVCRAILNPFRYPLYAWGLISHKLLRWLVPYFLIVLFAANLMLLSQPFYQLTLGLQGAFYVLALIGFAWQRRGKPPRLFGIPFSFCLVNLAALVGVARFVLGRKSGRWVPVR